MASLSSSKWGRCLPLFLALVQSCYASLRCLAVISAGRPRPLGRAAISRKCNCLETRRLRPATPLRPKTPSPPRRTRREATRRGCPQARPGRTGAAGLRGTGSPRRAPAAAAVRRRAPRAALCAGARGRPRCQAVRGRCGLFGGSEREAGRGEPPRVRGCTELARSFQEGLGGLKLKGFVTEPCGW